MATKNDEGAVALPSSKELSLDRTIQAHDRTLMAWVRTATSLISFGFTIYKFFQYLREQ
jgi:inner membrane protein YidH